MQFLKVILHVQLLQNIDSVPHVVQYILELILHPVICASFSPSPTGLLADLWTYQAGAHLRAFAYGAYLVWNALCPDIHIIWSLLISHLLKEILTSVFSIPFSCFALWLRPALRPHLCLLLPFLRQHHFFMTSPPPWILGIPASLSVPAPGTHLRCCAWGRQSVHWAAFPGNALGI